MEYINCLQKVSNPALKELLQEERLSEEGIKQMVMQFLDHVKKGIWKEEGWSKVWTDYSVSKLALNAHSRILAKQHKGNNLSVNCFYPGFTKMAMTRGQDVRTAEEAAEVGARLALLPPGELPTEKFFKWSRPILYSKL